MNSLMIPSLLDIELENDPQAPMKEGLLRQNTTERFCRKISQKVGTQDSEYN